METPHRILLIDDDALLTTIFSQILEAVGYDVAVVNEPEEAIAAALTFRPDLLLLDFDFPGTTEPKSLSNFAAPQD